jgi:hypothetical protein
MAGMARYLGRTQIGILLSAAAFVPMTLLAQTPSAVDPAQLIGTWRGTSTCTDRVAAPACHDETVVYEFRMGPKPGVLAWAADKVVDGKRLPMGELELAYDTTEACWKAEFSSPRATMVWRLKVDGTQLSGTGRQLPGNETVRKLELQKE